jgi:hypothetical protein
MPHDPEICIHLIEMNGKKSCVNDKYLYDEILRGREQRAASQGTKEEGRRRRQARRVRKAKSPPVVAARGVAVDQA